MRLVKIGIANVNSTVGAVRSNVDQSLALAEAMERDAVTIGCFPEQVVGGYPTEDLVQWGAFVAAQAAELRRFADRSAAHRAVYVLGMTVGIGGQLFNVAAVVHGGAVLGLVPKEKLPTYNVFYEGRTLSRGGPGLSLSADGVPLGDFLFGFDFGTVAVEVCEDVWSPDGPMRRRCCSGAELIVNLSASPYRVGVVNTRREMLATRSADNQCTLVYVNAVGGQDGLIFDGGGYVFQNGRPVLEGPRFRSGFEACVVDLDRTTRMRRENTTWRMDCEAFQRANAPVRTLTGKAPTADRSGLQYPAPPATGLFLPPAAALPSPRDETLDDIFEALALGLKDYVAKTDAFRAVGVALSGGRDSLLSLLIAWRARELRGAKAEPLVAFYMPTRFSSAPTRSAAQAICRDLGVSLTEVSIDDAFEREVEATRRMLGGIEPSPITLQNIQARLRALRMWDWANTAGGLFVQTGDMSEKAVGYTTIGGDLEGSLSVIANLPKTVVIALLERLHRRFRFDGIRQTLETVPGPELAAGQTAEAELMPFPVLDACLHLHAAEKLTASELAGILPGLFPDADPAVLAGQATRFVALFTGAIYKWVQAPLSLHVGSLDLERERALQLPVVQRNEWEA
jgi:NAD+ synthase (glutamine-hydrolysing)